MKTKFILHGGYTRKKNELNRTFFEEFVKTVADKGAILLVLFASGKEDTAESFETLSENIRQGDAAKNFVFVNANADDFVDQLSTTEAVFFQGGNTPTLLSVLKRYEDLASLLKGKTVAGSSAGAYALACYGAAHSEEHMRQGLGILPLRIICHYESPELHPSATSVSEVMETAPELELVLLRDCEWRVFNGR